MGKRQPKPGDVIGYGLLGQAIRMKEPKAMAKKKKKAAKKKTNRMKTRAKDEMEDEMLDRKPIATNVSSRRAKAAIQKAQDKEGSGNSWSPKVPGDGIFGTVISHKNQKGKFGVQLVLTLAIDEGVKDFFCNAVALSQLHAEGVRIGDDIAVVYKGTQQGARGRPYGVYTVVNDTEKTKRTGKGAKPIVTKAMISD